MSAVLGSPRRPRWVRRTLRRMFWPAEMAVIVLLCLAAVELLMAVLP